MNYFEPGKLIDLNMFTQVHAPTHTNEKMDEGQKDLAPKKQDSKISC